ncbi:MAG: hypothetical protein ACRC76_13405 [Proteocatella sp.]
MGLNKGTFKNVETIINGPSKAETIATGARTLSVEEYLKRETQATEMYNGIRKSTDDVSKIAQNSGMTEARVQRIKDHLFNKEYDLASGKGKFDPDYDIAQAWNRLKDGTHTKSDLDLLNHELFESKFEGLFRTDYKKAHDAAAIDSGRTWNPSE